MATQADRAADFFQRQESRVRSAYGGDLVGHRALTIRGSKGDVSTLGKDSQRAIARQVKESGNLWIKADAGVQRAAAHWLGLAAPALLAAFVDDFTPMAERAHAYTPVRTGDLAAGQTLSIARLGEDRVSFSFSSVAAYTFFVKYRKRRGKASETAKRVHGRLRQFTSGAPQDGDFDQVGREFRLGQNGRNRADVARYYWTWVEGKLPPLRSGPNGESLDGRSWWATFATKPFRGVVVSMAQTVEKHLRQGA